MIMDTPPPKKEFFADRLSELKSDRLSGASELSDMALGYIEQACNLAVDEMPHIIEFANQLAQARASMVILQNLIQQWVTYVSAGQHQVPPEQGYRFARALRQRLQAASGQLINHFTVAAKGIERWFTHSYSSTVLACLSSLPKTSLHVYVSEARPLNEGAMLATRLAEHGVSCTLITDAQAGLFLPEVDVMLIGADSLLADGTVVNKAGTSLFAHTAQAMQIPVWLVAESFKQSPDTAGEFVIEEMPVTEFGYDTHFGVARRNLYYDQTPGKLVNQWINENGVQAAPFISRNQKPS